METYILLGKYTPEGLENISADRTKKVNELVKQLGGNVVAINVVLGEYDLVIKVQFPGIEEAMKASVELSRLAGISFSTLPAVSAEVFDKLFNR